MDQDLYEVVRELADFDNWGMFCTFCGRIVDLDPTAHADSCLHVAARKLVDQYDDLRNMV